MKLIFEKQSLHYSLLIVLLAAVIIVAHTGGLLTGEFLGLGTTVWFYLTLAVAILHQVYVWFRWRTQLHYSLITRAFGQRGFYYYAAGFILFMISRGALILLLTIANKNMLDVNRMLLNVLAIIIAIPVLYVHYSIMRYFSFKRAMGIDHFDPAYRNKPLVQEGIFRFTSNGIYTFGVLILWIPGLVFASPAALLAALFHHAYIWVHYYATERPDMKRIYGATIK